MQITESCWSEISSTVWSYDSENIARTDVLRIFIDVVNLVWKIGCNGNSGKSIFSKKLDDVADGSKTDANIFFSLEPHQILSVEKSTQIESIISKNPRETAEYTWIIVDGAKEEECENRFKQFLAKKIVWNDVRTNYRSLWLTDKIAIHRPAHLQLEAAICYICGCTSK